MSIDYGMLFEKTVKKIFGKPKTAISFADYYSIEKQGFKSILLTMCIYEINYNPEKYNPEKLEILISYEKKASKNKNTHKEDLEFLDFLYNN